MPVFNVKVKHETTEAVIQVRADNDQQAREHVNALHPYDYLGHFGKPFAEVRKQHANRLESPFSSTVVAGLSISSQRTIVSCEVATEDCPGCGQKRSAH